MCCVLDVMTSVRPVGYGGAERGQKFYRPAVTFFTMLPVLVIKKVTHVDGSIGLR
jgi:hypothetical protein